MRMLVFQSVMVVLSLTPAVAAACEFRSDAGRESHVFINCPKSLQTLMVRADGCEHWQGEEPYDRERSKQIASAIDHLGCEKLPKDAMALAKKYKHDPSIRQALDPIIVGGAG